MIVYLPLLVTRFARRGLFSILFILVFSILAGPAFGQSGGGTDLIGTGGRHIIMGRLYFPSGRRTDVRMKVKLETVNAGDLSVFTDSNGAFSFRGLNAGTYTVVVDGGQDYETARESVYIDTDGTNARRGIVLPPVSRQYTVDISLRPKRVVSTSPGVINAALASVPTRARELYESALKSAQANDHKKAVDDLNQALAIHGDFPLALSALGLQYLKLNLPQKAAQSLAAALKLSPDEFTPRLYYGYALLQSNRFEDAETQLRLALKKNDNSWPGHMYLGMTLQRLRRLDESETELRRALEVSVIDLAMPHYYLGGIYWAKRDYQRAADELEKYLKLAPGAPDAELTRNTIKDLRLKK